VGSARLAEFAEAELRGTPAADDLIAGEIAPCFIDADGRRTDTIVLACTHYPLLLDRFTRLARWPVTFIDPAPAIARRVVDLGGPQQSARAPSPARMLFTSGREPSAVLAAALARFGIAG
jgi:glutamate racemase